MSLLIELLAAERRRDLEREVLQLQRAAAFRRREPPALPADFWSAVLRRYRAVTSV